MTKVGRIHRCEEIDLDRHGVIEASAGTGKTYTIEQLVVRILVERGVNLDRILVVTFTEKATGEMKERIRRTIERRMATDGEHRDRLREALDAFDTASIFTIHGFCHRVLQQHAFENGEPFELEVADDATIYERALRSLQRQEWPRRHAGSLAGLLQLSGFPGRLQDGESEWEKTVLRIAHTYAPAAGDVLFPEPDETFTAETASAAIAAILSGLAKVVGSDADRPARFRGFYERYGALNFNARSKSSIQEKMIAPLSGLVSAPKNLSAQHAAWAKYLQGCREYGRFSREKSFGVMMPDKWNKGGSNLAEACPELERVIDLLNTLGTAFARFSKQLAANTISRLKEEVAKYKKEHGVIGFSEMLTLVHDALAGSRGPQLRETLRNQYQYALVDEFQDTDPIQWSIFRKLFVDGETHGLFVIGDPKQAIYGFRGADVRSYLQARDGISGGSKGLKYSLSTNWRSIPSMIEALNRLFSIPAWFGSSEGISYQEVEAPPARNARVRLCEDRTGRAAVAIVALDSQLSARKAQRKWASLIAREIDDRLMPRHAGLRQTRLAVASDGVERSLDYGDICVLVRKNREAEVIEEALDRKGIPHSFYKKAGLYQSAEAAHLAYLLAAIAEPGDEEAFKKALLTRFFAVPLNCLRLYDELPASHPIARTFQEWRLMADHRRFAELFQSILESTGVTVRDIARADGERRITNYQHILQELEREAVCNHWDLLGAVEHLNRLRSRTVEGSRDGDLQRLETEESKVQIVTMHQAKGLEYPVVFLLGGFTAVPDDAYLKYHDERGRIVYDLARDPSHQAASDAERQEEERRLLYVALTRAMFKIYLPQFDPVKSHPSYGPVVSILAPMLETAWPPAGDGQGIRRADDSIVERAAESTPSGETACFKEDFEARPHPIETAESVLEAPAPLFPERQLGLWRRKIEMTSFSSLAAGMPRAPSWVYGEGPPATQAFGEEARERDDELESALPDDSLLAGRQAIELPCGPDTGSMLHEILEGIDYRVVAGAPGPRELLDDPGARRLIQSGVERYGLLERALEDATAGPPSAREMEVARLVWNTLNTPIAAAGKGRRVSELTERGKDRIHELEFHYPLPAKGEAAVQPAGLSGLGFVCCKEGFLKGYMDMVFRVTRHGESEGRFFLVDWKSNYIAEGYAPRRLSACMDAHNYHLQYRLYTIALVRWLRRSIRNFDFKRHFGGVYYVFLRGMNGRDDSEGVFFTCPESEDEVLQYEEELFRILNG